VKPRARPARRVQSTSTAVDMPFTVMVDKVPWGKYATIEAAVEIAARLRRVRLRARVVESISETTP
jgi:hypothetical protein